MLGLHCVNILVSELDPDRHYTGLTDDLGERQQAHNAGQVSNTSKYKPWLIEAAVAFRSRAKAVQFESCLKTHSGRAFAKKHY